MTSSRALVLLASVLLSGCGLLHHGKKPAAAPAAAAVAAPTAPVPMSATLAPMGSPVSGEAHLRAGGGPNEVRATVSVKNSAPGLQHEWAIVQGSCREPGAVLGDPAAYPPLTVTGDGSAEVTATIPVAMPVSGVYHVRVMRSKADDTALACGMLAPER